MLGIEGGMSPPFEMDNRGKRSILLDLTTQDGRAAAHELLSGADVFLTNVRPGALKRIGLDFESVAARNPRLVYGLITGYAKNGERWPLFLSQVLDDKPVGEDDSKALCSI